MAVYLLHATVPLIRPNGSEVRHYLGYTCEGGMTDRLHAHYTNHKSARVVQEFLKQGSELWLGRYWENLTRADERRMKIAGHLANKCLWCQLDALKHRILEDYGTAHLLGLPGLGLP